MLNGEQFDVINLSHVLEHIPDPVGYLKYIKKDFLKTNGIMLIEVPNTLGGHGAFEIAHPICFIEKTIKETILSSGLGMVAITKHSQSKPNQILNEMYLLSASTNLETPELYTIQKINPWIIKFKRRRAFRNESIYKTIKIILKEFLG
jgi:hypothetical protein